LNEYLIDTNILVYALNGQGWATELLLALSPFGISISIITYGELYQGAYYGADPPAALEGLERILRNINVLPLSYPIMERFAIARGQVSRSRRKQIGDLDFLIASTALVHDMTVVTRNVRDFVPIPGVRLYEIETAD
jgi:tRNA(fMet)-specific endonuclease VapC